MGRFAERTDVTATVEAAFDYVTDQDEVAEWNDHVQRVEIIGGAPVEVGSRLRQYRRRGKRDFVLEFEVTEHERPLRHTVEGAVFGVDTKMEFTFAPHDSGARVTMAASVTGRGLRALMAPIVTREMRKSTVAALDALRARLGTA
ncbi:MAG: SRPBCC family protein [Actinomycetota bacterium]